jgi:signal transduction histidine kinase
MTTITRLWDRLIEPSAVVIGPERRRQARLLLSVLMVAWILWAGVFLSVPVQLLMDLNLADRHAVGVVYPALLLVLAVPVAICHILARSGRSGLSARILVTVSSAVGFCDFMLTADPRIIGLPIIAVVISSLLLTPLDTIGCYVVTVGCYLLVPLILPGFKLVDLVGALILTTVIAALSSTAVIVRNRATEKIEEQAQELARNHEQLLGARTMEAIAHLPAGLAHEFNNLMTAIDGYAELIERHPTDVAAGYAGRIKEASLRAVALTDGLLAMSQQLLLSPQVVNLDDLLRNRERKIRSVLRKTTHLVLHSTPEVKIVRIDTELFCEAVKSLLRRAEGHFTDLGTITIETKNEVLAASNSFLLPEGRYTLFTVRDSGAPNGKEVLSRLFDPFYTIGEFGTGNLDLAAAYGIIRQSEGQIEVRSDPKRGNSIVVALPQWERAR